MQNKVITTSTESLDALMNVLVIYKNDVARNIAECKEAIKELPYWSDDDFKNLLVFLDKVDDSVEKMSSLIFNLNLKLEAKIDLIEKREEIKIGE